MQRQFGNLFWGAALILAGVLFLVRQMGFLSGLTAPFWMLVFAGFSLLFFLAYFVNGLRAWGWLFPACILGAISLTIWMAESRMAGSWVGSLILFSIAIPFIVAFALNVHRNWWALIPAWVMCTLGLVVILTEHVAGEWVASLILAAFGLPFLVVFLADRSRWWALIPAYVFAITAVIPPLTSLLSGEFAGGFVTIAIGLPFLVVYWISSKSWWAMIPAGIMLSIGLMIILIGALGASEQLGQLATGVMFLGWAATFGWLWLRRSKHSTSWAKYPAIALAVTAGIMFLIGAGFQTYWPLALIAAGIVVLYFGFRPRNQIDP